MYAYILWKKGFSTRSSLRHTNENNFLISEFIFVAIDEAEINPIIIRPHQKKFNPNNSNVCHQCGRTYKHYKHLSSHQKDECGKEPRYRCTYCSHRTWRKYNMKSHIIHKHPNEPLVFRKD